MYRFWVAGAAIFLVSASSFGAETFGSGSTSSSSAPAVTDLSFSAPFVTPTNNATSRFSGATGLGTVVPLNQTWGSATPRPMSFTISEVPTGLSPNLVLNGPTQWTDPKRSVTTYLGSSSVPSGSAILTPGANYFAPPKSALFAKPQAMR